MPDLNFDLELTDLAAVANGVLRLTLARPDRAELPLWQPGAHLDLHFSSNGVDYVRQYSLCGKTSDKRHYQVAVLNVADGRGGSAHIHKAFAEGDVIRVAGPRNNFALVEAKRYLFVAGGIGITPMLPMIAQVAASGADWRLVYCGRSTQSMAFIEDLLQFGADKVTLHESDVNGMIDLAGILATADPETAVYCCGPESMLRAVDEASAAWADGRVHIERFSARGGAANDVATEFEVEFARSGIVAIVPADRSILDVAEELGVEIESSCQEGVCGSCETRVISGTPDHRDSVLCAKERALGQTMMVCVSRARCARLVLDA